jgi:hypothetical protein
MAQQEELTGFLSLPPELRNEIYSYLIPPKIKVSIATELLPKFPVPGPDPLTCLACCQKQERAKRPPPEDRHQISFTRVNKQIRAEMLSMYHGAVEYKADSIAETEAFLFTLGPESIKHVKTIVAFHPSAAKAAARLRGPEWRDMLRATAARVMRFSGKEVLKPDVLRVPMCLGSDWKDVPVTELDEYFHYFGLFVPKDKVDETAGAAFKLGYLQ